MEKNKIESQKSQKNAKLKKKILKHFKLLINWHQLRKTKGECEIFGELKATEIKAFNQKLLLEIQNLLFKIRMQSLEFDSNDRPTELAAKATMQYSSTSTPSLVVSFQSIAQPSYQPFQLPHLDGLVINPLGFL